MRTNPDIMSKSTTYTLNYTKMIGHAHCSPYHPQPKLLLGMIHILEMKIAAVNVPTGISQKSFRTLYSQQHY